MTDARMTKEQLDALVIFVHAVANEVVNDPLGRNGIARDEETSLREAFAPEPSDALILPCDVTVGHTTIKAGCPVSTVLKSIRVHAQARVAFSGPSTKSGESPAPESVWQTQCDTCGDKSSVGRGLNMKCHCGGRCIDIPALRTF